MSDQKPTTITVPAKLYEGDLSQHGSTTGSEIARMTKIHGSPSLDQLFRNKGTRNKFNVSATELDRQLKRSGGR